MDDTFYNLTNSTFLGILLRFVINIFFLFLLIKVIYFRYTHKEKFLFTFFLMGIITFFICSMLRTVFVDIGMAFGLFAIFGILRLRTRNFSVKDMAYTFTTIGISVINSLKILKFPLLGVLIIDAIILLSAYILEEFMVRNRTGSFRVVYENLELLDQDKKQKLIRDLCNITGKEVLRFKILKVNYKRKVAEIEIFFKD